MSSSQKIALYSINDLKNATDDAIAPYLTALPKPYKFKQDHYTTNIKLALGYSAVVIAGVLFYADWKLGWDATKAYTAPACVAYFVLNGVLTYWIWAVEAGTVFAGTREGGQKLTLKSSTQKHKPLYKLKVSYTAPSGKNWENKEIEGSFTEWFNTHGFLQTKELQAWLARNIEVLGLAEKEKAAAKQEKSESSGVPLVVSAPATVEGTEPSVSSGVEATGAVPPSAKKNRPKKKT